MSETPEQKPERQDDRIPRPAIIVVIVGLVASLAIYGLSFLPGSDPVQIEWDTIEEIASPPSRDVGEGSFGITRTSLSALAPNEDGVLLYRVAGVVRIESGSRKPARVRCDIFSQVEGDTRMARSGHLRAAWPRPSSGVDVQRQPVPENSSVKFRTADGKKIDLPISDVVRRYSNVGTTVAVEWDGYVEDDQNWIWRMTDGTGAGTATLPWLVIFESETRPEGTIDCTATIDGKRSRLRIPFRQDEWPIANDQPDSAEAEAEDISDVE